MPSPRTVLVAKHPAQRSSRSASALLCPPGGGGVGGSRGGWVMVAWAITAGDWLHAAAEEGQAFNIVISDTLREI